MFSSLRSRLWLTYALIIIVALAVVAMVLFGFLISNPLLYRQITERIRNAEKSLLDQQTEWISLSPEQLQRRLEHTSKATQLRFLVFDNRHHLIADSQPSALVLAFPHLPRLRPTGVIQDKTNSPWLYSIAILQNGNWLLVAAPRPYAPVKAILNDEFFIPILQAGVVALLLSLILAFIVTRWIATPLQQLVSATHQMPAADNLPKLQKSGPREIQELVQAFEEMLTRLHSSQKSQRDFVANVSHEMKTPLTSIQGFAQAILDGTASSPQEQQQAIEIIYAEAGRMHRMVVDLLDLARLDAGTADLQFESVNLTALLLSIGEKFTPQAQQAGISLQVQTTELPIIPGDGDRLAQVLTNLVDNALRYTPSGGQVTLAASIEPDAVNITVKDTGAGISPEALPHIFERFYRADPARQGGTEHSAGLGLAIAHEIALAHQGTLAAESTLKQGTTFTLRLPLARPDASTIIQRRK